MQKSIINVIVLFFLCSFLGVKGMAQQSYNFKQNSVYIYNFIKYTEWASRKSTIVVGIVGSTPVEEELKSLINHKKSPGLSLVIKRVSVEEAKKCDVLVVAQSAIEELKALAKVTDKLPILVITERPNMSRYGACISFTINEDEDFKTEYQLSLKNCKARGLKISDQIKNNAELMR